MRFKSLNLGLPLLMMVLFAAPALVGQGDPNEPRGVSEATSYQLDDLDAVNLYSGNLTLTVPLGQAYAVGENLSYRFRLITNYNIWSYEAVGNYEDTQLAATPDLEFSNAGLGWQLSFGRLFPPHTPPENDTAFWLLVEADGSRRLFRPNLRDGDPVEANVFYARDGSYLRMRLITDAFGITTPHVESPDGTVRTFATPPPYQLAEMRDRFGNWMRIQETAPMVWTVADSVGRTHTVTFQQPVAGSSVLHVQKIDMESIQGAVAQYLFNYEIADLVRPVRDTYTLNDVCLDGTTTCNCLVAGQCTEGSEQVPLLRSVTLPDSARFDMDYVRTRSVDQNPGMINKFTLPTLGRFEWTYGRYVFPEEGPEGEEDSAYGAGNGVREKRVYDWNGILLGTWTYDQRIEGNGRPANQPAVGLANVDPAFYDEVTTWVTDPLGHQTIHYFSSQATLTHGKPFTPFLTDSTGGRFLSREVFDGPVAGGNLLRSEYLLYEADGTGLSQNARILSRRTVFEDDPATGGNRHADVDFSDFDGVGHYRTSITGGNFPSGNVRTSFTDFNPSVGTLGQPGFAMPTGTEPWILNTFTARTVTEAGTTEGRETCFGTDGLLLRERVLAGATPGAADLLRVFTYDAAGLLIREDHYGGDLQSLATGALCNLILPGNPDFSVRHSHQAGVRTTSEVLDGAQVLLVTLDQDIDPSTGLTLVGRDSAGVATTFEYDLLGRLTRQVAAGEQPILTTYQRATTTAKMRVTTRRPDPGNPGSISADLERNELDLDGLGRVVVEWNKLPFGEINQRRIEYDGAGHQLRVTEVQKPNTIPQWTTFENYDPFGRPRRVSSPDGHAVDTFYIGARSVARTIRNVVTTTAGSLAPATTTELYDRQGRLVSVTQNAGPSGQPVATQYSYDVGNRLTEVSQAGVGSSQLRRFQYDGRGFLLSEEHPEIDGAVLYSGYDSQGNLGRKRSGDRGDGTYHTDLSFTYDRAGRVLRLTEAGGRLYKDFVYATANGTLPEGGTDWRAGKLIQARRHNYYPDVANPGAEIHRVVTETFRYGGLGGRLSEKLVRGNDPDGAGAASFSQTFAYDDLGHLAAEGYPRCLSPRCEKYGPPRVIDYVVQRGRVVDIPGWAKVNFFQWNGILSQQQHFNGMKDTWGADPKSIRRPASISFAGRTSLNLGTYTYDGAGNIFAIGGEKYAYDLVGRLVEAELTGVSAGQRYGYDSFGNLISIDTTAPPAVVGDPWAVIESRPVAVSSATNRLIGATYDPAGNVTSLFGLTSLTYDPLNRVTQISGTGVNRSFLYDTSDNRIAIVDHLEDTEEWRLRGLHSKPVRSFRKTPEGWHWQQDWVYREGQLVATSSGPRWRHYHLDHLGSPRLVTDAIGNTVAQYHPFPYGEMAQETGPGVDDGEHLFRYTGHERDEHLESSDPLSGQDDLDYMLARFYSPWVGRFLGVDPILSGRTTIPQSWNRNTYAVGNPLNLIDPTGKYTVSCAQNDKKCLKNAARFEKARQENLGRGSDVAATAQAYGDPGVDNGIVVRFGSPKTKGAAASVLADITYNQNSGFSLSVVATFDPNLKGAALEAAIGHEGQHILDAQGFASTFKSDGQFDLSMNLLRRELETRAYRITDKILRANQEQIGFEGARGRVELGVQGRSPGALAQAIELIVTGPLYVNQIHKRQFENYDRPYTP